MLLIRTILHPTDFSGPSERAFPLACSLARDHGARLIVLLHVMPPPVVAYGEMMAELADRGDRGKLEERLRQLVQGAPAQVRVEHRVEEVGDPAEVIVRLAQEAPCDLVVMGTHGRTDLARLLMGSVAEQVVRQAACPVLTVKTLLPAHPPSGEVRAESAAETLEKPERGGPAGGTT